MYYMATQIETTKETLTTITIRIRPSTLAAVRELAAIYNRDVTEWMRLAIEAKVQELEEPMKEKASTR